MALAAKAARRALSVGVVGNAAEHWVAVLVARKDKMDLAVNIAIGSAAQIALFVTPVLVMLSYLVGPAPMTLQFWPGAIVMMFLATMTAMMLTSGGRSRRFFAASRRASRRPRRMRRAASTRTPGRPTDTPTC